MKIAYVITRADPIGGAQVHVRDLAVAMQDRGHAPLVVAGGTGAFLDDLRARGIPTAVLRRLSVPIHPVRDLLALREMRAVLADFRPDLIAAHSSKAGVLGRVAGRTLGVPVVLTVHGWSFTPGIPRTRAAAYRAFERLAGPLAQRIITVSEFDRRLALDGRIATPEQVVTVWNGMPDIPASQRADPGRTPARLIMVARFGQQKDHRTLFHALAGLLDRAWELDLIGEGPLKGPMESLASDLGVRSRVRFLGQRMDVDQLLAQAQAGLLVTNWEGFPLSILEAMRAGLPMVASGVGGVAESVAEGDTGYLVPRGAVEPLRERIRWLLDDPGLRVRLGANGRASYERNFTLDRMVERTATVYRQAAGADAAAPNAPPAERPPPRAAAGERRQ